MNYDYIIVGSGAGGASAAKHLSEAGFRNLILEEGDWFRRGDFKTDVFTVMDRAFRNFGNQVAKGRSVVPILQGCCVGGSTVINGAICHELPEKVYEEWERNSSGEYPMPLERIRKFERDIIESLKIAPTLHELEKFPVASTLRSMGFEYSAMLRNAPGCVGSGNCLQGCQTGAKLSMESSFLPAALRQGTEIETGRKVLQVKDGEVLTRDTASGEQKTFRAKRGIILAAGVVHTPLILKASRIRHPYIGKNFQCHLSFGVLARFSKKVREIEGQPQGIECFLPGVEGVKIATQLLPPELLFARVPTIGRDTVKHLLEWEYFSSWTASIRSEATGTVSRSPWGATQIRFTPTRKDMDLAVIAHRKITELLFKMGATHVYPGVQGMPDFVTSPEQSHQLSVDPRSYFLGAGHLFGTCRMGCDPERYPVDEHFRVRGTKRTYVLDASVFPSNIGVNPQLPIMAIAMLGAERIAATASA